MHQPGPEVGAAVLVVSFVILTGTPLENIAVDGGGVVDVTILIGVPSVGTDN